MREQKEIFEKVQGMKSEIFFGWEVADLVAALTRTYAEDLKAVGIMKPDTDLSEWRTDPPTDDEIRTEAIEYMSFAFKKANDERGISAGRSISHYEQWLWLLGADQLASEIADYHDYGRPQLVRVCEFLGIDPVEHGALPR